MKILYITHFNVEDINGLSGTIFHVKRMLEEAGNEVIVLDSLKINRLYKNFKKIIAKITNKKTLVEREPYVLRRFAQEIESKTKNINYDIVFAPSSLYFSFYKDKKPMVFYTDATFGGMLNYYINKDDYSKRAIRNGFIQERLAIHNSDIIIYTSEWAKQTAVEFHKAELSKCIVVNRGANIKHSFSKERIFQIIKRRNLAKGIKGCNFMFLGKDWERKGGPFACEIVRLLNEEFKIKAKLNIIGCTPNVDKKFRNYVNVIGFLNKQIKEEYNLIEKTFQESDFLLLPTRREAQGISYTEACSWGLPVIATNTGGVSGVVKNKNNGIILEVEEGAEAYVKEILRYVDNKNGYTSLAKNTFNYFEKELTWDVVGRKINLVLENVLEKSQQNKENLL